MTDTASGSLSARRAWIEILPGSHVIHDSEVALRKESVDRNPAFIINGQEVDVALRKESVDRNFCTSVSPVTT